MLHPARRPALVALAAALCLSPCLSACSSTGPGAASTATATGTASASPAPAPAASPSTADPSAPADGEDGDLAGGLDGGDMGAELLDPVPLDASATLGDAQVSVTSVEAVDGAGSDVPGDLAGPAVAVTVAVVNTSDQVLDLSDLVVDLQDADGSPFPPLTAGAQAPPAEVGPGATASGTWVFTVPADARADARVLVDLGAATDTAVLEGDLPSS